MLVSGFQGAEFPRVGNLTSTIRIDIDGSCCFAAVVSPRKAVRLFPDTRWSRVLALGDEAESVRLRALNDLMEAYRPALLHFLVRVERLPPERAEDTVQSFLMERILAGGLLHRADAAQGRLRSFLLKSFRNFLIDESRKERAARRMPAGGAPVPLEEAREAWQAACDDDCRMDDAWARQTVALALTRFQEECTARKRLDWWEVFEARVLAPLLGEGTAWSYDELARRHGFTKPQDAANALVSAKRAFGRTLRLVVADTVEDPNCVDEEIGNLCAILARKERGAA